LSVLSDKLELDGLVPRDVDRYKLNLRTPFENSSLLSEVSSNAPIPLIPAINTEIPTLPSLTEIQYQQTARHERWQKSELSVRIFHASRLLLTLALQSPLIYQALLTEHDSVVTPQAPSLPEEHE
jgi:hypothetical protein